MSSKIKEKKAPKAVAPTKGKGKETPQPPKLLKRAAEDSDESEEEDDELNEDDDEEGSEGEWEDEEESDEDDDVDGEGMEKLMKALGEDGLDDFAQEQLRALAGSDEEESDEEGEGEEHLPDSNWPRQLTSDRPRGIVDHPRSGSTINTLGPLVSQR